MLYLVWYCVWRSYLLQNQSFWSLIHDTRKVRNNKNSQHSQGYVGSSQGFVVPQFAKAKVSYKAWWPWRRQGRLTCIYMLIMTRFVGCFNENQSLFSRKSFLQVRVVRIWFLMYTPCAKTHCQEQLEISFGLLKQRLADVREEIGRHEPQLQTGRCTDVPVHIHVSTNKWHATSNKQATLLRCFNLVHSGYWSFDFAAFLKTTSSQSSKTLNLGYNVSSKYCFKSFHFLSSQLFPHLVQFVYGGAWICNERAGDPWWYSL